MTFKIFTYVFISSLLVACGGSSDTETKTPSSRNDEAKAFVNAILEKETSAILSDSSSGNADLRQTTQTQQKRSAPKIMPKTPLDEAVSFDDAAVFKHYILGQPSLLEDVAFRNHTICSRNLSAYRDMSKNEFSFQDFLVEKTKEIKDELEAFSPEGVNSVTPSQTRLFRARISTNLGDYNFDEQVFAFDPITFDYLEEVSTRKAGNCGYDNEDFYIQRPQTSPTRWHVTFANKADIQTLGLDKQAAKILIDDMTAKRNTAREVEFDFVFALPSEIEVVNKRYDGLTGQVEAKLIWARVVQRKRDRKRNEVQADEIIATYPLSFFANTP